MGIQEASSFVPEGYIGNFPVGFSTPSDIPPNSFTQDDLGIAVAVLHPVPEHSPSLHFPCFLHPVSVH